MKTYDFINEALGKKVYLTYHGDLGMDRTFRRFISEKTELLLKRLTKGGMAIVEYEGKEYSVPPRNIIISKTKL